jgi:hypothetical protein
MYNVHRPVIHHSRLGRGHPERGAAAKKTSGVVMAHDARDAPFRDQRETVVSLV